MGREEPTGGLSFTMAVSSVCGVGRRVRVGVGWAPRVALGHLPGSWVGTYLVTIDIGCLSPYIVD